MNTEGTVPPATEVLFPHREAEGVNAAVPADPARTGTPTTASLTVDLISG